MTQVLDASAVVAILLGEPGAEYASHAATSGLITSINLAEVRDRLGRASSDRSQVVSALDELIARGLRVTPCDRALAEHAADLRAEHYHRERLPVSLADCCAIAEAIRSGGALVSSDGGQLRVAVLAGAPVQAIANSEGVVPVV